MRISYYLLGEAGGVRNRSGLWVISSIDRMNCVFWQRDDDASTSATLNDIVDDTPIGMCTSLRLRYNRMKDLVDVGLSDCSTSAIDLN